jgi:peptidoglycan/LPS O-acetylase OafA/YrhL
MRWFAAILVALQHYQLEKPSLFDSEINQKILPLVEVGAVGVPIFFIISGYVMSLTAAVKTNWFLFSYARFVRLLPGLLVSMILVVLVGSRFIGSYDNPQKSFLASVSLTYNVFDIQPLTTVLWTLLVEIKFYFAIALILLVRQNVFQNSSQILVVIGLIYVFEITSMFGIFGLLNSQLSGYTDHFLLGISLYFLTKNIRDKRKIAISFALSSGLYSYSILGMDQFTLSDWLILFSLTMILLSSFVQIPAKFAKFCSLLGLASYPIYLIHTHVGMAIINVLNARTSNSSLAIFFGGVICLTLLCIAINQFLEKPAQNVLKNLLIFKAKPS